MMKNEEKCHNICSDWSKVKSLFFFLAQTYFGQVSNSTALTFLDHMKNNTFISGQSQVFFFSRMVTKKSLRSNKIIV